jgi:taurine dioxygenase
MHVQYPPDEGIGVEITDFDLAKVTPDEVSELRDLVYRHKLLVFRGQRMDEERYLAMARRFGRPQIYFQAHYHHPDHPEIFVSSNVPKDGKKVGVAGTGRFWHTDYSFFDEPLSTTFVYPQIIPKSGKRETYYIDMERVYRELPEGLRARVEGTRSFHEVTWYYKVQPSDMDRAIIDLVRQIRAEAPGAVHPTVIRHPITGARFLYVSEGFTTRVEGLDYETSGALLAELFAFIGQERFIHVHAWREGDVLYWDNRGLLHRASETRSGEPSMSYRIGVYDGLPFYALESAKNHAAV